ncbi:MAG: hypothetical protein AAF411_06395 [Myxococcota bacterium]
MGPRLSFQTALRVLLVAASCVALGCGDDDGGGTPDQGLQDLAIPDAVRLGGNFVPDLASDSSLESGLGDLGVDTGDASAPRCPGECRPDEATCRGVGACVLRGPEPMCVDRAGSLMEGDACETVSDCRPGLACFRRGTRGECGRVCCPADPSVCGEELTCGAGVLVDGTETTYGECRPPRTCDIVSGDECTDGEACYRFEDRTDCAPEGSAMVGEACEGPAGCGRGLSCVGAFEGVCARNCRLGERCPSGEGECQSVANSPPGFGLCRLPE